MTRSGDEPAANSSQPCPKGQNHGRISTLEAAYDGYRLKLIGAGVSLMLAQRACLRDSSQRRVSCAWHHRKGNQYHYPQLHSLH